MVVESERLDWFSRNKKLLLFCHLHFGSGRVLRAAGAPQLLMFVRGMKTTAGMVFARRRADCGPAEYDAENNA